MLRVLLASADEMLIKELNKQLRGQCLTECCSDGEKALELLRVFDPDVLLIDTHLAKTDCITVLRTIRTSGRKLGILVVTNLRDTCTMNRLVAQNVNYIMIKPCRLNTVIAQIREIGLYMQDSNREWCPENEVENILLDLSFRVGPESYNAIRFAVLAKYYAVDGVMMKEIYYQVAKAYGGNSVQKEKAIRDGIKAAWARGDLSLWQMYFPPDRNGQPRCPTNEEFITRIANCLLQRSRIKRPYQQKKENAI